MIRKLALISILICSQIISFSQVNTTEKVVKNSEYKVLVSSLLKDWCDGLLTTQINEPENPKRHGALFCDACQIMHGRCADAAFPLLYMADVTGDKKYLDAAIKLQEWSTKNMSREDGAWFSQPEEPKSWWGISIFGAIALAEALHYHGHLLTEQQRAEWTERLSKAADAVYKGYDTIDFTNINYGTTAVYGLNLLGHLLHKPEYIEKSHAFAQDSKRFFTTPNQLLFGETKPTKRLSNKGLYGVDLGYNVEEPLNALVLYALQEKDTELIELYQKSLESHAAFMLPDGGWDNSWGTRQFKWTYWGSRTSDGSQIGYAMLADKNPSLGAVAIRNTELLKRCTSNGFLYGGLHYQSHGIKPCIHHTFEHAKPLAFMLNNWDKIPELNWHAPLPRETADGLQEFPEISTSLLARGPWRATITTYDAIYQPLLQQATGGAMSVLYHNKVGLLCAASMANYIMFEPNNMQPQPGVDFAITPRIETHQNGKWYTNLFDLKAKLTNTDDAGVLKSVAHVSLNDSLRNVVKNTASDFEIRYQISDNAVEFIAKARDNKPIKSKTAFVLPIVSEANEKVLQVSPTKIEIMKPQGTVIIESNVPLIMKTFGKSRVFNMVPGVETVPIYAYFRNKGKKPLKCTIKIK